MKHQQVVVDYWYMVKTSLSCLFLAFLGYILIKMVQAVFWLPGHLDKNQKRLEELAKKFSINLDKTDIDENDINKPVEDIAEKSEKDEISNNKKDK